MPRGDLGIYALGNSSEGGEVEARELAGAGGDFVRFRIAQKFPSFFPTTPISDGRTDRPPTLFPTVRPSVRSDVEHEFPLLV